MKKTALAARMVIFGLTLAITPSFAVADATASSEPLLQLIRQHYNPATPLETRFTLTIYWHVREKEEKKQGAIVLAPGNRFRVSLGSETFVSNGTTLWSYNARANQVVLKNFADVDLALHPSRLFATTIGSCPFRELQRNGGTAELSWTGDSGDTAPAYTRIRLWVHVKTGSITKCILTDRNKNTFTYVFSGTVFGKKTRAEAFEFAIPKAARVVDSRK